MIRSHTLPILCSSALLLGLTGCGGSNSSSSPAAAATPDPSGDTPATETMTVTGFVTDMPIPNATVILTVDGQSFEASLPTGADGSYEVEIETADPDALVLCEAFDPNGVARFTALLDNFAGLQERAGGDGVVADQNITNVTTAQYLLAQQLATDGSIDDIEELREIAQQVDTDQLLDVAAAIKIVVDGIESVPLPAEYSNVQELASAIVNGDSTFLEDIEVTNPGIVEEARDLVVSDGNATVAFDPDEVPGVYVGPGIFTIYTLYDDNTGLAAFFDEDVVDLLPSWSVTDAGALAIDFVPEFEERDTIVLLSDADGVLNVTLFIEDLSGQFETETETTTLVRFGFEGSFTAENIVGSYSLPSEPDEVTVFLAGGSGYEIDARTGIQDDPFTWEITADGEAVLTYADGWTDTLTRLEQSTDAAVNILLVARDAAGAVDEMEFGTYDRSDEIVTGPAENDNTALLTGKTYALTELNDVAVIQFGADGVLTETAQFFEENVWEYYEETGTWVVAADGTITTVVAGDAVVGSITSGLGEDEMVYEAEQEISTFTRVTSFDAAALLGTWDIMEEGAIDETLEFNADGTGRYLANGDPEDDPFTWEVSAAGHLVLELEGGVDVEEDTFYRLADSTATEIHAVWVYRVNGQLDGDVDFPGEEPGAVEAVTLVKRP